MTVNGSHVDPTPENNHVDVVVTVLPGPAFITVVETIVVADTPVLTPAALLTVTETVAVSTTVNPLPVPLLGITESIIDPR